MKVSILVPVYNVEKFFSRCLESLFSQTYSNIEYVFVNDCTPDNSMIVLHDILQKYPNHVNNVKLIENPSNNGIAIVRNTLLDNAHGDYVLFVDSDDWIENDMVEIRGIKIDKTARRVWVNGEEKQFTTKEFDLLTFLAENPNRVFTKEELFQKVWDMESIGDIATVTVHIKKIREKVELDTSKPQYIETIWGVGYRFKL